jgi:hypothetical protein
MASITLLPIILCSAFLALATASVSYAMAQVDLVDPLPEFGSFLDENPDDKLNEPQSDINGGVPDNVSPGIDAYEKFQECLSDAKGQDAGSLPSEQQVRDCVETSYNIEDKEIPASTER